MAAVQDEEPVQALPADGADKPCGCQKPHPGR
jgi:hypothetical protein